MNHDYALLPGRNISTGRWCRRLSEPWQVIAGAPYEFGAGEDQEASSRRWSAPIAGTWTIWVLHLLFEIHCICLLLVCYATVATESVLLLISYMQWFPMMVMACHGALRLSTVANKSFGIWFWSFLKLLIQQHIWHWLTFEHKDFRGSTRSFHPDAADWWGISNNSQ